MTFPLLQVDRLAITFRRDGVETTPVRAATLAVGAGERVALVGESGCGKSLTAMALTRLSPTDRARLSGRILFEGRDLLPLAPAALREMRGRRIAYVFQDPSASLNPVMRIGDQIGECLPDTPRAQRLAVARDLLAQTGLPDPGRAVRAYPCELSGGQQQRAVLAMALAARPSLLVADEPTTALDVTTQRHVLALIDRLADETGMALLLITHNLGLVAGHAARVYVMYAGRVVEGGPVADVLARPCHPYTRGLLEAVPSLDAPRGAPLRDIPGTVPSPDAWPAGCAFAPRCPDVLARCQTETPPERTTDGHSLCCWNSP